uniref:Prolyl 4-hydroxylase alpha-subunit N-terminal domain-containing protein n=1 Tax=Clastoptera arizonana TaxID=38151 RepID=A0A1B6C4P5_9HEMI
MIIILIFVAVAQSVLNLTKYNELINLKETLNHTLLKEADIVLHKNTSLRTQIKSYFRIFKYEVHVLLTAQKLLDPKKYWTVRVYEDIANVREDIQQLKLLRQNETLEEKLDKAEYILNDIYDIKYIMINKLGFPRYVLIE